MENGTEKQIKWAKDIKTKTMVEIDDFGAKVPDSHKAEFNVFREMFAAVSDAIFWIDCRDIGGFLLLKYASQQGRWNGECKWQVKDGAIVRG